MTDTLHNLWTVAWHLRYVITFAVFLTTVGLALLWRHERNQARGRAHVLDEQLNIEATYGAYREPTPFVEFDDAEESVFSEGYAYDRQPGWLKDLDVPGSSPREPRRVPR